VDTIFVGILVVFTAATLGVVAQDVASGATQDYITESEQWCNDHGGELHNSQSVVHGGLHCELENGTSVHMSEKIEVDQ
jgi:hypothetical protein